MDEFQARQVLKRNNVLLSGAGEQFIMFAHGFGCDHNMWRFVAPHFEQDYKVIRFDNTGAGSSDETHFDPDKYSRLEGYAEDVIEILQALDAREVIFVGHSVSAMIGILAAVQQPELFARLVLVGPSPSYINEGDYIGGFERKDIEELLGFLDANYLGWSHALAPTIMGNADRPELGQELENSFCRTNPDIARHFARTTFLSDYRSVLPKLKIPSLILQCSDDVIAPEAVGRYMHAELPDSSFVQLKATGHCPNLSAPDETVDAIKAWLPEPVAAF